MTGQNLDDQAAFTFMMGIANTINRTDELLPGQDFKEAFLKLLDAWLEAGILSDHQEGLDTREKVMVIREELGRGIGLAKIVSAMKKDP